MNTNTEIDSWLVGIEPENEISNNDVWEPGFEVNRQIIQSKLGPYNKFFLRPENFIKRFYHTVYPLPIEEWHSVEQIKLYDGFCTITMSLDIRFQATYNYALSNIEILSELNEHIKNAYQDLSIDIVNKELLNLTDGSWVKEGLEPIEKKICTAICEMLILQNIQSQVMCILKPEFEEFPDTQFAKENVYLHVLKKSFEFDEKQKEELFRQQQEEEKQQIEHKRLQLKQLNEMAEINRKKLAQQAENNKKLLKQQEQQQAEQFEIKKRIHEKKVKHNNNLKEMTLVADLDEKERHQARIREKEEQDNINLIAHQVKIKEKELEANIAEYEKEQASWREVKDTTYAEELDLKQRQKQLKFTTDINAKKRYDLQRLAMQEESFSVRKKADVYLKREIELLELEKQRLILQSSIKEYKKDDKANNG